MSSPLPRLIHHPLGRSVDFPRAIVELLLDHCHDEPWYEQGLCWCDFYAGGGGTMRWRPGDPVPRFTGGLCDE